MHSSSNLFLTISSAPTKPNPQNSVIKPIFSPFLAFSSAPTKQKPQNFAKNPIFSPFLAFSSDQKTQIFGKNPIFFTCRHSNLSSKAKRFGLFTVSCFVKGESQHLSVVERVHSLTLEFRSLVEPIDRVKRLLHYANLLPPLTESARVQENRVMGCTTQVWLDVRMDQRGSMRFSVDSDSEITKGFCSCLLWVLDGAEPEEIMCVEAEDLADMNVGLPRVGRSRVNTWHNVLFSMQRRTHDCVVERERERRSTQSLQDLRSLVVVRPHGFCSGSVSCLESEVGID